MEIIKKVEENHIIVLVFILLTAVMLAWSNRFVGDDAFITFRYSYNLAHGKGLVWNDGERVEGYTNLLWALLLDMPIYFEKDPVFFSYLLGIFFFVGSLSITYSLALMVFGSCVPSLLVVFLLGTNHTFSAFATSGLETQMQAFLFSLCLYIFLRMILKDFKKWELALLSTLLGIAVLTRPDSILLMLIVILASIYYINYSAISVTKKIGQYIFLLFPAFFIVNSWLVWKYFYYGDLLPNTFYLKTSSTSLVRGIHYLYLFCLSYFLFPILLLFLFHIRSALKRESIAIMTFFVLIWSAYVAKIGGDFMEFRFLVPIMPLIYLLTTWTILTTTNNKLSRMALLLMVLFGSIHHVYAFGKSIKSNEIESVNDLGWYMREKDHDWDEIGRVLGKAFDYSQEVTIATSAAGAIPFYSKLKAIDILGLNDKNILNDFEFIGTRPGHQKLATFQYLLKRNVNILIGHPWMRPIKECFQGYTVNALIEKNVISDRWERYLPNTIRIIEIPVNSDYVLVVVYLIKNPIIDAAIEKNGWKVFFCNHSECHLMTKVSPPEELIFKIREIRF